MRRYILMLTAAAIMTAMLAISALPSQAAPVHCDTLDDIGWWVITGEYSPYGGTLCH
jgi:hypothetical protein